MFARGRLEVEEAKHCSPTKALPGERLFSASATSAYQEQSKWRGRQQHQVGGAGCSELAESREEIPSFDDLQLARRL